LRLEALTETQERSLSRLCCLRNAAVQAIEGQLALERLDQVSWNLIQNLQKSNQKVK